MQELIEFEMKMDNSLQRDLIKMEHVRMHLANEGLVQDLVDMELIELKFIFDRCKHLDSATNLYIQLKERSSPPR